MASRDSQNVRALEFVAVSKLAQTILNNNDSFMSTTTLELYEAQACLPEDC